MRDIIRPGIVLFAVTLIASTLLGVVNVVTADIILERELETKRKAMLEVLPQVYNNNFSAETLTGSNNVTAYSIGYDENGGVCGYVFTVGVTGYGGAFEILVGLDTAGTVTGISVGTNGETPGLGKNAEKPKFLDQFTGRGGVFSVVKGGASAQNGIDAISAATITSNAVTQGVNQAIEYFMSEIG